MISINNTIHNYNQQTDNAKDIDVVMPMHNLIEYSGNYFRSFWQHHTYEPSLNNNGTITDFCDNNTSVFHFNLRKK